jgi:HPt (histidine-containing phosphotransfer) domain-containing protein
MAASDSEMPEVPAPPLVPEDQAIDVAHLSRMTLGDPGLEHQVLELFDRQAELLLPRIRAAAPSVSMAAAHTLKGSARGIGAWRVARSAESLEAAAPAGFAAAISALEAALAETKAAIADLLQARQRSES